MTTQTFDVQGMTCDHCVHAVTEELEALDGVNQVSVDLNPGGPSHVTLDAQRRIADTEVAEALEEAGAYVLA